MRKIIYCLLSMTTLNTAYGVANFQPKPGEPELDMSVKPLLEGKGSWVAPFDPTIVLKALDAANSVPEGDILAIVDHDQFGINGNSWQPMFDKLMSGGADRQGFDILVDMNAAGSANEGLLVMRNTPKAHGFIAAWAWNWGKPLRRGENRGGHANTLSWLFANYGAKQNLRVSTLEWGNPLPVTFGKPAIPNALSDLPSIPLIVPFNPQAIKQTLSFNVPTGSIIASLNPHHFTQNGNSWAPTFAKLLRGRDMLVDENTESQDARGRRLVREDFFVMINNARTRDFIEAWAKTNPISPGENRAGHLNTFSWQLAKYRETKQLMYSTLEWNHPLPVTWHAQAPSQAPIFAQPNLRSEEEYKTNAHKNEDGYTTEASPPPAYASSEENTDDVETDELSHSPTHASPEVEETDDLDTDDVETGTEQETAEVTTTVAAEVLPVAEVDQLLTAANQNSAQALESAVMDPLVDPLAEIVIHNLTPAVEEREESDDDVGTVALVTVPLSPTAIKTPIAGGSPKEESDEKGERAEEQDAVLVSRADSMPDGAAAEAQSDAAPAQSGSSEYSWYNPAGWIWGSSSS